MIINWFPGHMTKSLREIDEKINLVDAVVYVLDSRAPFSCINPALNKVIGLIRRIWFPSGKSKAGSVN